MGNRAFSKLLLDVARLNSREFLPRVRDAHHPRQTNHQQYEELVDTKEKGMSKRTIQLMMDPKLKCELLFVIAFGNCNWKNVAVISNRGGKHWQRMTAELHFLSD